MKIIVTIVMFIFVIYLTPIVLYSNKYLVSQEDTTKSIDLDSYNFIEESVLKNEPNKSYNDFLAPLSKVYLKDKILNEIPEEVISLAHQFNSFDDLEDWINKVVRLLEMGSSLPSENLDYLEDLTLLFGLESGPGINLMDSLGSRIKNHKIKDELHLVWDLFYNPGRFSPPKFDDIGDVNDQLIILFNEFHMDNISIKSRIKQWGSNILKLEKVKPKIQKFKRAPYSLTVKEVIREGLELKNQIAKNPNDLFDDLIGFNIEIDDTDMNDEQRSIFLTKVSKNLSKLLEKLNDTDITIKRKVSAIPEFEAINIWIQGLLNHQDFGRLPIKLQVRFKTALMWEVVERYMYKIYGRWELPPWAKDLDMSEIKSFKQLQRKLFDDFKQFTINDQPKIAYNLVEKLTEPEGFIPYLNWQHLIDISS